MKALMILMTLFFALPSMALTDEAVTKLVKEDIRKYDGRMLGVRFVDELNLLGCDHRECIFNFKYEVSGCYYEDCFDLSCSGELAFDKREAETNVLFQECVDLY